jgi:hypothetical protein
MENYATIGGFLYLAIVILMIVSMWKTFEKAGQPGWACIIPIYQLLVFLKIVGKPWWWIFLIMFLPFIFGIWATNLLSKSFGNGVGFTLGLLFLPFIFYPVLGLGDAKYQGAAGK